MEAIASLSGHTEAINNIILLRNGHLASSSWDKTLKLWDINNRSIVQTLKGHCKNVSNVIQLKDDRLASVSYDGSLKIWAIE